MLKSKLPISYNPIQPDSLNDVLRRYEGKPHQQIVTDFERELAKTCGAEFAVALNSGTSAIHLTLLTLGVGPGDVVIVPTFTYVATVNPILYVGAKPIFIDSESDTWNMDPKLLEEALIDLHKRNCKPKVIIVVHTYGMPAKMDEILSVADRYEIPVVEDAAEALGSTLHGRMAGVLGSVGIYSFNNNKIITTYGGGAILTQDAKTASRIRFLASQARENLAYYEHRELGYNCQISVLNAAYGLAQWPILQYELEKRQSIFNQYRKLYPLAQFQNAPEGYCSNYWVTAALFKTKEEKQAVADEYEKKGYETRPVWKAMHTQPLYQKELYYGNHWSDSLFERGLCLPVIMLA